jgi:hypothetical protein
MLAVTAKARHRIYMSLLNNINKLQQYKVFLTNARQILILAIRDVSLY